MQLAQKPGELERRISFIFVWRMGGIRRGCRKDPGLSFSYFVPLSFIFRLFLVGLVVFPMAQWRSVYVLEQIGKYHIIRHYEA